MFFILFNVTCLTYNVCCLCHQSSLYRVGQCIRVRHELYTRHCDQRALSWCGGPQAGRFQLLPYKGRPLLMYCSVTPLWCARQVVVYSGGFTLHWQCVRMMVPISRILFKKCQQNFHGQNCLWLSKLRVFWRKFVCKKNRYVSRTILK